MDNKLLKGLVYFILECLMYLTVVLYVVLAIKILGIR